MTTQGERITSLEQDKKWHWWVLGGAITAVVPCLIWISFSIMGMKGDLQAIKQKIKDGGLGDIVSQIQNPTSPQQLNAVLNLATSQIEVQQANKIKPDPQKLEKLSAAVRGATLKNPDNPTVWQAGARLVNYRYQSQQEAALGRLPSCLGGDGKDSALKQLAYTPDVEIDKVAFRSNNCLLDLDANPSFFGSEAGRFFEEANRRNPGNGNIILLSNAVVTYSGGPTIPINRIDCVNCIFRLPVSSGIPSKAGQFLTDQLLISDISKTTVTLPQGM